MSPFFIDGPALISFSGGRTSGLMLHRILDAHGGRLPPDVHVVFANTGKERHETLDFVDEVSRRWNVHIWWVEYRAVLNLDCEWETTYAVVDFASASRNGEPFLALVGRRKFLPNPVMRICTAELKIRPMKMFMLAQGYEHWINVIGMRADEPHRIAKLAALNAQEKERWIDTWPLGVAGVTKADVKAFWRAQPFDLRLKDWEGNCDLCFLKSLPRQYRVMQDRPDLVPWWIEIERRIGGTFRKDQVSVAALFARAQQPRFDFGPDELLEGVESLECGCTD